MLRVAVDVRKINSPYIVFITQVTGCQTGAIPVLLNIEPLMILVPARLHNTMQVCQSNTMQVCQTNTMQACQTGQGGKGREISRIVIH